MNTKFALCFFPLLFLLLFNKAQTFVNVNDTAYLFVEGYKHGQIQWQQSSDTITWTDISGASVNNYPLFPVYPAYYRAKVNSGTCNTLYSQAIKIELSNFQCGDTLIDYRDGQKYPTVLIGTQCWFAKNLNIGEKIDHEPEYQTDNGIIEKFCYNNDENNCDVHGGLYTWTETMAYDTTEGSRGICPSGWHVPSDQEWIDLELALGMDIGVAQYYNTWRGTDQGTQLKVDGTSGYEALLSGNAIPGGYFNSMNQYEFMHSSSHYGVSAAWRRCVRAGDPTVGRWNTFTHSYGLSVRCLKN